jgi:FkbM family methyltransferase
VLHITDRRIEDFCRFLLEQDRSGGNIGFVDVGSGGDLKEPWSLLPAELLTTFDFEPTNAEGESLPLCISNKVGKAQFHVAHDERASSFQKPLADFVERYALDNMLAKTEITVACTSLDEHFSGRYELIDAVDINVEGHDFQVLQGADNLLAAGAIKLLKIEFELIPVYEGQGYFADIDTYLRARNFRLADIQIGRERPAKVRHVFHSGEPMWGKALYAPTQEHLMKRLSHLHSADNVGVARKEMAAAIALYTATKLPGYVYDVLGVAEMASIISASEATQLRARIVNVFRWAKLEEGLRRLGGLGSSFMRTL